MATKKLDFKNVIMALGAGVGSELAMDKLGEMKQIQDKPYLAPLAIAAAGAWATTNPKMESLGYGMLGAAGAQLKITLKLNGLSRLRVNGVDETRNLKRANLMKYIEQVKSVAVNGNEPLASGEIDNSYMAYQSGL